MNPAEYRTNRRRTSRRGLTWEDELLNASLGLGEAGELQNLIKKHVFHEHDFDPVAITDEAGDLLYYIDWLLELIGSDIPAAMEFNVEKLRKRYPNGFDTFASRNRDSGSGIVPTHVYDHDDTPE